MDPWAAAAGSADLVSAPVFGFVAWRMFRRPVPERARLPASQFSLWWAAVGAGALVTGVEGVAGAVGALSFAAAYSAYLVTLLVDAVALWGLVSYLVYIYFGKYHLVELSGFYALFYVAALYYTIARHPYAVYLPAGVPTLEYSYPNAGVVFGFVVLALLIPEILGVVLYVSLLRRTTERTPRYRIVVVSASLVLYFGLAFFAPPASLVPANVWTLGKAMLDVFAAGLAFAAYFPPVWVQRRLGVEPVPGPGRAVPALSGGN